MKGSNQQKFPQLALMVCMLSANGLLAVSAADKEYVSTLDENRVVSANKLESIEERAGFSTGKRSEKVSAGNNISLTRRTESLRNRASQSLTINKTGLDLVNPKLRGESPVISSKAFGFEFYNADVFLDFDRDGDGYFSDFTLEFDADYDNGSANVYAVVYTRPNGGDWVELFETDVFSISFDNSSDFQSISTTLNFGFPTNNYDILIDLYENGVSGIVATIEPLNDADLGLLPLEDDEHELNSNASDITFVASTVFGDADSDGFYTGLTLEYDIETDYTGDTVYAEIIVTDTFNGSRQFLSSDNFILGNQTEIIDLTFNAGYPAGWYNVEINLINVFTNEEIAGAAQEFSSLKSLPIESIDRDDLFDSFDDDVDIVISSGSLGGGLLLIGLLVFRRNRNACQVKA